MHINIDPPKVNSISAELLDLSRSLRRSREGVEDVQHQLRQMTELDECKAALRKQEESLADLTAKLVNMSLALREIGEAYRDTEEKIQDTLEERPQVNREPGKVIIYGINDALHRHIQQILYQ